MLREINNARKVNGKIARFSIRRARTVDRTRGTKPVHFFSILHGDPVSTRVRVYPGTEHNACPGYVAAINYRKRMLTARLGYLLTG